MLHHLEGIAVALVIGAGIYGVVWMLGALKKREIERYRQHIEEYLAKRGERLLEARWRPFGPGAQAGREKLFSIVYVDREGREHSASCKSGVSGVYLTDDEPTDE